MLASIPVLAGSASRLRERGDALWLALVPIGVALTFGILLLPRGAVPDAVPVPIPDGVALAHAAAIDRDLARRARAEPLPATVRALGSALRDFHMLEVGGAEPGAISRAREAIDKARVGALAEGDDAILRLRAAQLESFLVEIARLETTGSQSRELWAVAGDFVRAMQAQGWSDGRTFAASEPALRAMFKEMWNNLAGVGATGAFAPGLDEERALYALYLARPHPAASMRDAIAAARRGARDARSCQALVEAQRVAVEAWRLERIGRLAAIDPTYPAAYARGVASLRRGDYPRAVDELSSWLHDHPDGPYALRARSSLRAAYAAARIE